MKKWISLSGCGLLLLWSCDDMDLGPVCDEYGLAAIVVTLADSTTNGRIPSGMANVRAVDGAYADSASASVEQFPRDPIFLLALERPGVYRVDATVTGYRPWSMSGIIVRMDSDGCHVVQQNIRALMQKTS